MDPTRGSSALLAGLALTLATGCLLPETPAPLAPLTCPGQSAVVACDPGCAVETA